MSLIGQRAKFNQTDEFGKVTGEVTGVILDKVVGIRKVLNQLPIRPGQDGNYRTHIAVDFYLLKTEEGIVKVEATQYLGFPEKDGKPYAFIGTM